MYKVNAASIPRSQRILIRANCDASDAVGHFVYITGPSISGRYQVTRVDINDSGKMPAIGIIIRKQSTTRCTVQTHGLLSVPWSVLTPQSRYYVGSGSVLTGTAPILPSLRQLAGIAIDSGHLLLELVGLLAPTDLYSRIYGEEPSGAINGVNKTYITAMDFRSASEAVFLNGVRQREGVFNDYVRGSNSVTFSIAPITDDTILIDYDPA